MLFIFAYIDIINDNVGCKPLIILAYIIKFLTISSLVKEQSSSD